MSEVIGDTTICRRRWWVQRIASLSGDFGADSSRLETELSEEMEQEGLEALLDHLRLCSAIPESYAHDSSEEKLYSKYTDALLRET